jgi:hypothetical protein
MTEELRADNDAALAKQQVDQLFVQLQKHHMVYHQEILSY